MNLRDFMNNNSALVTILAVVILVISLGVIVLQTRGPGQPGAIDLYFYDLTSNQLFVAASDQIPPIATPNGENQGVRAHVFACGECPANLAGMNEEQVKSQNAYIAYLEMYTPQGKQALMAMSNPDPNADPNAPPPGAMVDPMEQTLVKKIADTKWLSMYSQPGYQLTDQAITSCPDGSAPRACRPE